MVFRSITVRIGARECCGHTARRAAHVGPCGLSYGAVEAVSSLQVQVESAVAFDSHNTASHSRTPTCTDRAAAYQCTK